MDAGNCDIQPLVDVAAAECQECCDDVDDVGEDDDLLAELPTKSNINAATSRRKRIRRVGANDVDVDRCLAAMHILLTAGIRAKGGRIKAGADRAYVFRCVAIPESGDEEAPLQITTILKSAIIVLTFYSQLTWALGKVSQSHFELDIPFKFASTLELQEELRGSCVLESTCKVEAK